MNNSSKEQIGCDTICKSHSARTERDLYRICPSKLSKRELEDLYFALLENNLELKKNINIYQDKIKVLSTKLQRMTVQKNVAGKEKDCCASKAVVHEQRESLTDLKKTNERMADRIRLLNMRLCSAKQFLKRSPSQSNNCKTCTRCSFKNSSMSALNPKKKSDSNMRTTAVSCQFLEKDVSDKATRTVETETHSARPEKGDADETCNENKCKTTMLELKEKINNLQEELTTSHNEYSERIAKLESLVSELHDENLRVRSEHVASEHTLQQREKKADLLQDQLRTADAKCSELNMELSIEKRKVAELETGLKLANLSNHVIETIDQLAATKEEREEVKNGPQAQISSGFSYIFEPTQNNEEPVASKKENNDLNVIEISRESSRSQKTEELSSPSKVLELPVSNKNPDVKNSKSDDSGYTELNKSSEADDDQAMVKLNRELLKKIAELQTQLDVVKISAAGENVKIQHMRKPRAFESYDKETENESNIMIAMSNLSAVLLRDTPPSDANNKKFRNETELPSPPIATVPEDEPTSSKPWENLLIKQRSVENVQSVAEESSNNSTVKVKFDTKAAKDDNHNSYQIPGPLPAVYPSSQNSKDRKKNLRNQNLSKESLERLKKKPSSDEKTVKIFEESENESAAGKGDESSLITGPDFKNDDRWDSPENQKKIHDEAKLAYRTPTRDSIFVNKKKLTRDEATMAEVKKESESTYYLDSLCTPPLSDSPVINNNMKETSTQVDEKPEYELCEARAAICRCPSRRRDVAVFRSCSGTLRFRTSATTRGLRACDCLNNVEHCGIHGTQMDPASPTRRDSATYTADIPQTYTVPDTQSRATSPVNTDHEISSLSDLPSEKDGKSRMAHPGSSPRAPLSPLSPGEDRGTMTSTDTETDTAHYDYGTLSEGELPVAKKAPQSAGEWTSDTSPPVATSSERMEATLQSITEELARCRRLLLNQRSQENGGQPLYREREPEPTSEELGIALRQSAANRHIVESNSLSCVFILHIGTLVLSDESVMYCRDKTLLLTWKFYTQNAAMTRVQSGRVVQFDFVTEYDVAFNDDFLDYMKHSDMAIVLCEMNKQEEPFAMCTLPLREALLHANRRADMSLALVPASNEGHRDSMGDEIGVLDLWCTLRVDVSLMPTIHRVMHMPSPQNAYPNPLRLGDRESKIIQQAVDDEVSSERLSRDLDLSISKHGNCTVKQSTVPEFFSENFDPKTSEVEQQLDVEKASSRYDDEVQGYQPIKPYRRRSTQTQKSTPSSDLGQKGTVGFKKRYPPLRQDSSGIIINEVPAFIRSSDDMKLALERNVQHDTQRMLKIDDESSNFQSSMGSVKSSAVRHQLSRLRLTKNKMQTRDRIDSLEELLKKKASSIEDTSNLPLASTEGYVRDQDSERSKMINISKYIATTPEISKIDASKKTVKYNDTLSCDELQKDSSADSDETVTQSIDITILWLALNEECEAMVNSSIQKLYVAYSFLGRRGADLETPFSLPKPKHYADKCYFNFKKTFHLHECDLPLLGHMSRCRAGGGASTDPRDCIVFTLISEPAEDPLGLSNCEDIGYAYLYLGDVLAYSGDSAGYTEVVGVRGVRGGVCGVLAVRVDQLPVLRRALALAHSRSSRVTSNTLPSCHLK